MTSTYLRLDNGRRYHNWPLLPSLEGVGERTGVMPLRCGFSEPRVGKDMCDRKTSAMKAYMKRWVIESDDVVTAEDTKAALEYYGGIKGCSAAVVEVDSTSDGNRGSKILGFSVFNNFHYEECGKAYNIGTGRLIPYGDLGAPSQRDIKLKVISHLVKLHRRQTEAENHMDTYGTVTSTSAQGVDSSSPSRAPAARRPLGAILR